MYEIKESRVCVSCKQNWEETSAEINRLKDLAHQESKTKEHFRVLLTEMSMENNRLNQRVIYLNSHLQQFLQKEKFQQEFSNKPQM
jgi:hypothetical protein